MKQKKQQPPPSPPTVYEQSYLSCREGWWLFVVAQAVALAAMTANHVVLRWRSEAAAWPSSRDVQMPWLLALGTGLLLALGALCLRKARHAAEGGPDSQQGDPEHQTSGTSWRWIVLASTLCLSSVALRYFEIRGMVAHGIYPRSPRAMLYDRADLLYLQAVRQELDRRYGRLEEKLRLRPDQFTNDDRSDLERVAQLQNDMVRWTERDVALRDDDWETKKVWIETVAYQIRPLRRLQAQVETSLQDESRRLNALRGRLELLKDYYSAKSRLQRELREADVSLPDDSDQPDTKSPSAQVQRVQRSLQQLDEEWRARMSDLTSQDRAALQQAMEESADWSATTRLTKDLDMELGRVVGRQRFLDEMSTAATETGTPTGLNQQYPWLQLPMLMPGANRWASSCFLMIGVHTLYMLLLLGLLLGPIFSRSDAKRRERVALCSSLSQCVLIAWIWVELVVRLA